MRLSILIPTLYKRSDQLISLKASLYGQIIHNKLDDQVEIICMGDNGEKPTGWKRNRLLEKAKGDYIVFVDDDDSVQSNYVKMIYEALLTSPDVVGIVLKHYQNGILIGDTYHTIIYKRWKNKRVQNDPELWRFERCPNHLNPVRRDLALQVRFPEIYIGEDKDYSLRLRDLLIEEVMISEPLYNYMETV